LNAFHKVLEKNPDQTDNLLEIDTKTQSQAFMLRSRLVKRQKHLKKWAHRAGVGAYRVYDRDIPEIPLVIDYYHESDTLCAVSGALYKRPYEKDYNEELAWLSEMENAAMQALEVQKQNIFLKLRQRSNTKSGGINQYQKSNGKIFTMIVNENGLKFLVNLSLYIDTGLFFDLRGLRLFVKEKSESKKVLNLFCYSGAFSVYAAAGKAALVDSVDMSNTYLEWAKKNFLLNNFSGNRYNFIHADAIRFIDDAVKKRQKWDIIILDPPTFSNSKKMEGNSFDGSMDIKRDHTILLSNCLKLLNAGGTVLFCVNSKSFKFNTEEFLQQCISDYPGITIKDRTEMFRQEDFKGRRMSLCYVLTI
jgi:23S rRNA G2069 N7-methylase RlmK/C1962 C5-methylase RlmI